MLLVGWKASYRGSSRRAQGASDRRKLFVEVAVEAVECVGRSLNNRVLAAFGAFDSFGTQAAVRQSCGE